MVNSNIIAGLSQQYNQIMNYYHNVLLATKLLVSMVILFAWFFCNKPLTCNNIALKNMVSVSDNICS